MSKLFPDMNDRPDNRLVITICAYWPIVYVLFPVLIRVMAWDVYNQPPSWPGARSFTTRSF